MKNLYFFLMIISQFIFSGSTSAEILFQGDWKNFVPYFYDSTSGWKNLNRDFWGQPTSDAGWEDHMSYFKSKRTPHTWEINTSFARDRITLDIDPQSPKGGYVAKFVVKSGDHRPVKYSGERSEMSTMLDKNGDKLNVTKGSGHEVYGISVKVPEDWTPPQKDPRNGNMWGIFMQLHSPNVFDSPPAIDLSVESNYALRMNGGELYEFVTNPRTGVKTMKKKDCVKYDLSDGSLKKGQWVQFLMDVNWSETKTGYVKLYRRDQNETNFRLVLSLTDLPTLQTSQYVKTDLANCPSCRPENTAHYWRVGYYRSESENLNNTLWLGSIVRGTSLDEVAVAAFGSTGSLVSPSATNTAGASSTDQLKAMVIDNLKSNNQIPESYVGLYSRLFDNYVRTNKTVIDNYFKAKNVVPNSFIQTYSQAIASGYLNSNRQLMNRLLRTSTFIPSSFVIAHNQLLNGFFNSSMKSNA